MNCRINPMPTVTVIAALCVCGVCAVADAAIYYVDSDGSYVVNLVRQYDADGNFLTQIDKANEEYVSGGAKNAMIDGAASKCQWSVNFANRADAQASAQVTLDRAYSINKIFHSYRVTKPLTYDIRVSDTGFGSMNEVVAGETAGWQNWYDFTPQPVQYIEVTWHGAVQYGSRDKSYVGLQEIMAFAHADTQGPLTNDMGFNVYGSVTPTITDTSSGDGGWADSLSRFFDQSVNSYLRGNKNAAEDDAQFVVDYGETLTASVISAAGFDGQKWGEGMKIEVSADDASYSTVFDGTPSGGMLDIPLAGSERNFRYVRVTNVNSNGDAMVELEVHTIPEPATMTLLAVGLAAIARRRRVA